MRQTGLFGLSDQLKRLSDCGDPLETMGRVVSFEVFRPALEKALAYGDSAKGGRPPYDPVAMFKVLILAAQNTVSDARMEFLIRDRLSWLRFLGFDLGAVTPDENTIRLFREKLTRAGAIDALFAAFDRQLRDRGYLPMGGQIVDATLVAAPKQRNTATEKDAIKAGRSAAEIWPDQPAKAAQKDTDARWTVKFARPVLSLSKGPGRCRAAGPGSTSPSPGYRPVGVAFGPATKAASRSVGATGLYDRPRSPTARGSTGGCCATSLLATTPPPTYGRTPPIGAEPTRRG